MNFKFSTALAIAAVLIALPPSGLAQTADMQTGQATQGTSPSNTTQEAAKMVPAAAVFTTEIDSRKMQPGAQFQAKLLKKVQLENGPELPTGTVLVGQVVRDGTQSAGSAKLALRFTQANLKSGGTVPIKATIINVYNADNSDVGQNGAPPTPDSWDREATAVDQIDALSGVDLHSNIASPNSGVLVSTRKDDIKLSKSTGVELAIAPQGTANQASTGGV